MGSNPRWVCKTTRRGNIVDDLPDAPETLVSLAKEEKIKRYCKFLEDNGYTVDKEAHLKNKALFTLSFDNKLGIMYQDKIIYLTYLKSPSQFLLPTTIASSYGKGGASFVRDVLGIKKKPNAEHLSELLKINKTIASTKSSPERKLEEIEMQTVAQVEENLNTFLEASAQTELALGPEGSLPFRELAGLDRSLRNMRTTVLKITSNREAKKATLKQLKDELKDETSKVANDEDREFSEDLCEK